MGRFTPISRPRRELRRAMALEALDGVTELCLNQMRGTEPEMAKVGYLLRLVTAELRTACQIEDLEEPVND